MAWRWAQNNVSPIAVDFGTNCIKLLQVTTDDSPRLVAAAAVDIPWESRGSLAARLEFVNTILGRLVKQGHFKGNRVLISIPAAQTHIQHLRLAKGDKAALDTQVNTELRKRFSVDPSCMVVRWIDVGEVMADGAAKQEVICLATGRQAVMGFIQAAAKHKLEVVGMHCEPLAIVQSFAHLYRRKGDELRTTFFVDIGATTTKALITHGSQLVFAKSIQVAGDHFDQQLAKALNIDLADAHERRRNATTTVAHAERSTVPFDSPRATGERSTDWRSSDGSLATINDPDAQESTAHAHDSETPVEQLAASAAGAATATATAELTETLLATGEMQDCLLDELQLCVGYHSSMFRDRPVQKIVFLGGDSRHIAMCQRIARSLSLPAQLGDPLARLGRSEKSPPTTVDLRQPQPGWAVPLGLCLLPPNV